MKDLFSHDIGCQKREQECSDNNLPVNRNYLVRLKMLIDMGLEGNKKREEICTLTYLSPSGPIMKVNLIAEFYRTLFF